MRNVIVLALGMVAIVFAAPARAGNLGIANSFTEFSFGSSYRYGDSAGLVAVGGDATFDNFTIGSSVSGGGNALVVGGNLGGSQTNINGGGNASYNSISNGTHVYFNDGGTGIQQPSPVDFGGAETYLKALSTTLENTASNGTTSVSSGAVTLTPNNPNAALDVFTLSGSVLSSATSLTINAPSTATVVVNIDGTSDSMQNFQTFLSGGITSSHILYNFYQATTVTSTIQILGSVLAPDATLDFYGGESYGTLIANEINSNAATYGSGQSEYDPFTGSLPTPSAVPEPSSVVMMLNAGAFGLITLARRQMRRRTA